MEKGSVYTSDVEPSVEAGGVLIVCERGEERYYVTIPASHPLAKQCCQAQHVEEGQQPAWLVYSVPVAEEQSASDLCDWCNSGVIGRDMSPARLQSLYILSAALQWATLRDDIEAFTAAAARKAGPSTQTASAGSGSAAAAAGLSSVEYVSGRWRGRYEPASLRVPPPDVSGRHSFAERASSRSERERCTRLPDPWGFGRARADSHGSSVPDTATPHA